MLEISNNVVCATSKASDQPAHTRSLIRVFACRLASLWLLSYWLNTFGVSKLKRRLQRLVWVYTCQNVKLLEISCRGSNLMSVLTGKRCQLSYCQDVPVYGFRTRILRELTCHQRRSSTEQASTLSIRNQTATYVTLFFAHWNLQSVIFLQIWFYESRDSLGQNSLHPKL